VVGSALVDAVRMSLGTDGKPTQAIMQSVADLVRSLADGVRGARQASAANVGWRKPR